MRSLEAKRVSSKARNLIYSTQAWHPQSKCKSTRQKTTETKGHSYTKIQTQWDQRIDTSSFEPICSTTEASTLTFSKSTSKNP